MKFGEKKHWKCSISIKYTIVINLQSASVCFSRIFCVLIGGDSRTASAPHQILVSFLLFLSALITICNSSKYNKLSRFKSIALWLMSSTSVSHIIKSNTRLVSEHVIWSINIEQNVTKCVMYYLLTKSVWKRVLLQVIWVKWVQWRSVLWSPVIIEGAVQTAALHFFITTNNLQWFLRLASFPSEHLEIIQTFNQCLFYLQILNFTSDYFSMVFNEFLHRFCSYSGFSGSLNLSFANYSIGYANIGVISIICLSECTFVICG